MARRKLGEMLIEAGVIDEASLRSALAEQKRWGKALGRTLIDMRLITEELLVSALSRQLNIAAVDLSQIKIPANVIALVPVELASNNALVPMRQVMKFLDVAMADPTDMGVLEELRIRTQLNIRPYIAGPKQIAKALETYYGVRDDIPLYGSDIRDAHAANDPAAGTVENERHRERLREGIFPTRQPTPTQQPSVRQPSSVPFELPDSRDNEIDALQERISKLEGLVERDEQVLRRVLALLVDKGIATREEILERLK